VIEGAAVQAPVVQKRRSKKAGLTVELNPTWEAVRRDVLRIDRYGFGLNAASDEDNKNQWGKAFMNAVVRDADQGGSVVGYTMVFEAWPDTAYIRYSAIAPEWRGKGVIGILMDVVEKELRAAGIPYLSRDARIENGYADKVEKHYGDRIVAKYDHASLLGPLRFFRIRL
jgi:GNAT superfamily N-acetyltransferase